LTICLVLPCWVLPFAGCCQGASQLAWVIAANEEMARFMILADAFLADQDKVTHGCLMGDSWVMHEVDGWAGAQPAWLCHVAESCRAQCGLQFGFVIVLGFVIVRGA
jgi:hypothetical protein